MVKKSSGNPTPSFFGELAIAPKPLSANVQALFLPKLVAEAAGHRQMAAMAEQRARAHAYFRNWIKNYRSGQLATLGESQLEQDFTTGMLTTLGYQTQGQVLASSPWSVQTKWPFLNTGIADAALGTFAFGSDGKLTGTVAVVVELKGPKVDLDRSQSTGRSPVRQAFDYLNASEATTKWALVSNFVEFRLYSKEKGRNHVHRVLLDDLDDDAKFSEFFAVFHADSLLSDRRLAYHAAELLKMTEEKQQKVGDELYTLYDENRWELIKILQTEKGVADLDTAIRAAQKLLDRVLFIAFAEDRKLLDKTNLLEETYALTVPMNSAWDNFRNLFRAFNVGHKRSGIPGFNGGLFARDEILDAETFELDDRWPNLFQTIGKYDFKDEVTVEVLGEIFERSITDLETLRERGTEVYRAEREKERGKRKGQRRRQGVFYTNEKTVGYLVGAALDPSWDAHRAAVTADIGLTPAGVARALLGRLDGLTVCDPACGSGAFLIAAYGWFEDHRMALLDDLALVAPDAPECAGGREDWRARCASQILGHNLYGVDLASEAVEIARLSLWIRTARKDQKLTDLSHNVVEGNSVVDDPAIHPRAFTWAERFPAVFARGGFDAVVGNPPYVRQEWLGAIKPHLAARFLAYHGMADLYVYFYERGLQILKAGGRLAFVVTNKWMKAGYGEPLRRYFAENAWVEQVVDFGHAKQFFPDADVFPCFLVARKPDDGPKPEEARVCVIPREMVKLDELTTQVGAFGIKVRRDRFGHDGWNLEPKAVGDLLSKMRDHGIPLVEYAKAKPLFGIKTGFNEAFLIDDETRNSYIKADPKSKEIIVPYLRGQDIKRWHPEWAGLWMILLKSSSNFDWPWAGNEENPQEVFQSTYPVLFNHLIAYKDNLIGRQDQGRNWWELRSCKYYDVLNSAKIIWQDLGYYSRFCLSEPAYVAEATCFALASSDLWLLAVLNSPVMWAYLWRHTIHGKDEVLRLKTLYMEHIPICHSTAESRIAVEHRVHQLLEIAKSREILCNDIADWLKVQFEISDPTMKLRDPVSLDGDAFIAEVQKARGKAKTLSAAGLKQLREEYATTIEPARTKAAEARALEVQVSDLVNAAYGLTPEEIRLMWDTAPPRMPIPRPAL
jgi:Eco57I restriction-modification methylase/TaqI-like C-terminal specificity domain